MIQSGFPEDRILVCNDDVIVVNKAAGEAMEGAGSGMIDLPALLKQYLAAVKGSCLQGTPEAVHRIDVPVTGCALFALNAGAAAFLGKAFSRPPRGEGGVEKRYWAVVELSRSFSALPESGELVHWMENDIKKNKSIAYHKSREGLKEAILRYRITGEGTNYGFMELELVTGRHHQIRAQLAALGIHIKGDLKYGAKRSERGGGIRLHARSLCFPNPSAPDNAVPDNGIKATALPPVMDALWEACAGASNHVPAQTGGQRPQSG
jgi:23S rRNA pseudouridine1911/1915/1917 synthase